MDYLRYLKQIKIFTAVQGMVAIFYPKKFLIHITLSTWCIKKWKYREYKHFTFKYAKYHI